MRASAAGSFPRHFSAPALLFWLSVAAWIPAQLIGLIVEAWFPRPKIRDVFGTPLLTFTTLVLAPMIETLLMLYLFRFLRKWTGVTSVNWLCVMSAVLWTFAHIRYTTWGLHATWAFFIYGRTFMYFEKMSQNAALIATAIVHALFNFYSYFGGIIERRFFS